MEEHTETGKNWARLAAVAKWGIFTVHGIKNFSRFAVSGPLPWICRLRQRAVIITHQLRVVIVDSDVVFRFFFGACRFCLRSGFYYAMGHGELSHATVTDCHFSGVHARVRLWNYCLDAHLFLLAENTGNALAIIVRCPLYKVKQSIFVSRSCSVLTPLVLPMRFCSMVFLLVIIGIYFVISTLQPGSRRKLKLVSNGGWSYVIWRVYIRRVLDSCLVLPLYQVIDLILFCLPVSVSTYHDLLLSSLGLPRVLEYYSNSKLLE